MKTYVWEELNTRGSQIFIARGLDMTSSMLLSGSGSTDFRLPIKMFNSFSKCFHTIIILLLGSPVYRRSPLRRMVRREVPGKGECSLSILPALTYSGAAD